MPALQNEQARSSPAADLHLAHLAPAVADRAVVVAASKSLSEPVAMKAPRANGEGSGERGNAAQLEVVRLEHQSRTSDAKRRPLLHHGNQKRAIKADVGGVELLDEGLEEEVLRRAGRVHHLCARTKH